MEKPLKIRFLFLFYTEVRGIYEGQTTKYKEINTEGIVGYFTQKRDGEDTYHRLFYEIKKELFQTEQEFFTEELKTRITIC